MTGIAALAVYAGLLALLAIGVFVRPPTALAAVLCIYGLKQWGQSTNGWLAAHPPATNLAIGALVLCAILTAKLRGRCIFCGIPGITWLVFALLLYSLLSVEWTPRPDLAWPIWLQAYPYLLTFVVLVPVTLHDAQDFRAALSWLIVVGGTLTLVLLVLGHWSMRGLSLGTHSIEAETDPLALAGLGGSVAATALLLTPRRGTVLTWALRLAIVGAGLMLIVRSESRGQLLAAIAGMLVMIPAAFRVTSIRGVVAAAVGIVVIGGAVAYGYSKLATPEDTERFSQRTSTADAAVRLSMVEKLLSEWSKSGATIVFGLGNSASWDPDINGIYPHNVPMEVLGEEGVVGFVLYIAIFVGALLALLRAALRAGTPEDRSLAAALGGGFLFFALITFKQGNMIASVEFFMYVILLARLSQAVTAPRQEQVATKLEVPLPYYPNIMR